MSVQAIHRQAWYDPLHIRLALVVAVMLAVVFGLASILVSARSSEAAQEATQRQNLQLATTIALMQPRDLIDLGGHVDIELVQALAASVMKVNPTLEIYLLDAAGKVLSHALDGLAPISTHVDLEPVRQLAMPRIEPPRLPVLGDNPRQPGTQSVFSAAALGGGTQPDGYLYVVLDGPGSLNHGAAPAPDSVRRLMLALAALIIAAIAVSAWVLRTFTRPLVRLRQAVRSFDGVRPAPEAGLGSSVEIRELEQAIFAMQERIKEQLAQLQHENANRRELIGNVSHDLRTPLAHIRGYIETLSLEGERLDPMQRAHYLSIAQRQADRISHHIDSLLALSTLESGMLKPKLTDFSLAELAQDVLAAYRTLAQSQGIGMRFEPGPNPTMQVSADIGMLEQVLQNLIDNALRHCNPGGRVRLSCRPVTLGTGLPGIRLQVANTGQAIPAEHLPHLFDRYWQADSRTCTGIDGDSPHRRASPSSRGHCGLGLAIVKRILELHQAPIRVHTQDHNETIFEFDLAGTHPGDTQTDHSAGKRRC